MKLCVISHKECWQDTSRKWFSTGGFPLQMKAIASLFEEMSLLVPRGFPKEGGVALPEQAQVVPLPLPKGANTRRKMALTMRFPTYARAIVLTIRQADVVHTPLPGDISLLGFLAAVALGKRLIARYGGSWAETAQTTAMNRFTKACMRQLAGGRRVMLATGTGLEPPAPAMHWLFATALSNTELESIHPNYDRGLSNPPRLAYIGRLSTEKGVRQLIEAVGCLKQEGGLSGLRFFPRILLIGDGPEKTELENLVRRLGCEEAITFTGQLDRRDLSACLRQVDFCVQPSLTESLSKAWLDAMAHGLPVLATDVGAAGEVIGRQGERGWLVPPGDVRALAGRLRELLNVDHDRGLALPRPQEWPNLRKRCRAFVEGWTLEAWAESIGLICARQWGISLVGGKLRE